MCSRLGLYLFMADEFAAAADCFAKMAAMHAAGEEKFIALCWLGLLADIAGNRPEAVGFYEEAMRFDPGEGIGYSSVRLTFDGKWLEERLKTPFSFETMVAIPADPTADDLVTIVDSLNWRREGKTPLLIHQKAADLVIGQPRFWFKLALLLFDSGYYPEAFAAFERTAELADSELYRFAAYIWMGHLKDLMKDRAAALGYYRQALEHDTGRTMQHGQYRMYLNREWVEKRLRTPFVWK
jgi:tetratricopeptide (TPR) repeat protein